MLDTNGGKSGGTPCGRPRWRWERSQGPPRREAWLIPAGPFTGRRSNIIQTTPYEYYSLRNGDGIDISLQFSYIAESSRPQGRRRVTPAERGECGSRGWGCQPRSRAAPGRKRPAGMTTGLRVIPPAAPGRPGADNTRSSVVPSRKARELELSGGVRSLPQAPWWNADRRARPAGRAAVPAGTATWKTAPAGVLLPFCFFLIGA